ncbi:thiamine-phosphate pyrophosphorylase [Endobacter medicaginis]|jgi:thiamine-phosphate pyrophosphorylase|uniref:Thiamine-phosphate synthase n=3 Tax=Endobacter medicaginis TaxID=1181271 RepID=A0A839UZ31_9PROT|nr:thiamine phosphate synthase [Endobacter medicaginis]MBB3173623.1 thiamine-phosphate pyrophosphorylase [Endobacter medicaginis]MCX5477047.1 thiamine phosphate synthase [Endobacter medicaginis]
MTRPCQLYLITPPALVAATFADTLARALDAGEVAAVQLRLKDVGDDELLRAIDILRPVAQSRDVAFLLNDRADLAARSGCDGAHVGASDGDVATARRLLGPDLQLGVSCYDSRELAMLAGEAGADYVAFGAIYESPTKQTDIRADLSLLGWWSELMELPCVAIGGLTPANCAPVVQAGADFLAVVSAVWSHPDGAAAGVRAMLAAIHAA